MRTRRQLNLRSGVALHAFALRSVCQAESAQCASGVAEHEVWVSDDAYEQDYSDPSQRCFHGIAPDRFEVRLMPSPTLALS